MSPERDSTALPGGVDDGRGATVETAIGVVSSLTIALAFGVLGIGWVVLGCAGADYAHRFGVVFVFTLLSALLSTYGVPLVLSAAGGALLGWDNQHGGE